MKIKAIQSDKYKKYCVYCGTWTIEISKKRKTSICINLNHNYFKKKNPHKGDNDG